MSAVKAEDAGGAAAATKAAEEGEAVLKASSEAADEAAVESAVAKEAEKETVATKEATVKAEGANFTNKKAEVDATAKGELEKKVAEKAAEKKDDEDSAAAVADVHVRDLQNEGDGAKQEKRKSMREPVASKSKTADAVPAKKKTEKKGREGEVTGTEGVQAPKEEVERNEDVEDETETEGDAEGEVAPQEGVVSKAETGGDDVRFCGGIGLSKVVVSH